MGKYKAEKAYSDATNGFDKTIQWKLLMCGNVTGNNNKFFNLELQHNESTGQYRLFSHYGRLAGSVADGGVYDVRGPDTDLTSLETEFDKIIKDKTKGKTKTADDGSKYTEAYHVVDVVAPTVGSPNIRKVSGASASATVTKNGNSGLSSMFQQYGATEQRVLGQLLQENIHNITTSTTLTMTANGLETPLGPLTLDHIEKAKVVLDNLKAHIPDDGSKANLLDKDFRALNSQAFSLVPRPFARGYTIQDNDLIFDMNKLLAEYDLLDQMKSTVQITSDADDDKKQDLGFEFALADKNVTEELFHYVNSSRKHRQLDNWKPVRCYAVKNDKERDRYLKMAAKLEAEGRNATKNGHRNGDGKVIINDYDVVDLFHGSKNSNVLSIMLNSFYIPPATSSLVVGRMYSSGIYGANSSTKSLNYSLNNWSRTGLTHSSGRSVQNVFLFITKFAMGKTYRAPRAMPQGAPREYNSIYAPGGYDLANDEFIVRDPAQATVTHLIEFENR